MAYADAIRWAGGRAELHVRPGAFHGFDTYAAPGAALSRDAPEARDRRLRGVVARSGSGGGPGRWARRAGGMT
ncbi:hypothetical protein ACIGBL_23865 [Streptomyces sp. NPDC085614]|uniref:hypothetical protein n=1 Tax=Streptomyces sp. NPDC085614 TaxID=3365733 RepID=UPI0037CD206F